MYRNFFKKREKERWKEGNLIFFLAISKQQGWKFKLACITIVIGIPRRTRDEILLFCWCKTSVRNWHGNGFSFLCRFLLWSATLTIHQNVFFASNLGSIDFKCNRILEVFGFGPVINQCLKILHTISRIVPIILMSMLWFLCVLCGGYSYQTPPGKQHTNWRRVVRNRVR